MDESYRRAVLETIAHLAAPVSLSKSELKERLGETFISVRSLFGTAVAPIET